MSDVVRLTVVPNEGEAEMLCQLLRSEGIRCAHRIVDMSLDAGGTFGGWREVTVDEADLARAQELLPAT